MCSNKRNTLFLGDKNISTQGESTLKCLKDKREGNIAVHFYSSCVTASNGLCCSSFLCALRVAYNILLLSPPHEKVLSTCVIE